MFYKNQAYIPKHGEWVVDRMLMESRRSSRHKLSLGGRLCIMAQLLLLLFFQLTMKINYLDMHKLQWDMWKSPQHFAQREINVMNLNLNIYGHTFINMHEF